MEGYPPLILCFSHSDPSLPDAVAQTPTNLTSKNCTFTAVTILPIPVYENNVKKTTATCLKVDSCGQTISARRKLLA